MKTKILFILGFLIVFIVGVGFMVYLTQQHGATPTAGPQTEEKSEELVGPAPGPSEGGVEVGVEVDNSTLLVKDDFTLNLPSDWVETTQPNTWPIVITNLQEEITNEKAKEINFQTNLSINRATLEETLPEDYIENVKTGLIHSIPVIEIVGEEKTSIDGKEAYLVEVDSIQQDLNFKTLLVFVAKENMIWALSFNTLKESWPNYQETFQQIAKSFKIK